MNFVSTTLSSVGREAQALAAYRGDGALTTADFIAAVDDLAAAGADISTPAARWELTTDKVLPTDTAKRVEAAQRSYALRADGVLEYAESRAMVGEPMTPHVSAELHRFTS